MFVCLVVNQLSQVCGTTLYCEWRKSGKNMEMQMTQTSDMSNHAIIWVNYSDRTLSSLTGNYGLDIGNHPQMAARFRLVKYYNLPRIMQQSKKTCACLMEYTLLQSNMAMENPLYIDVCFKHVLCSIIYGLSSFSLTNSYFSRWLKPPTRFFKMVVTIYHL